MDNIELSRLKIQVKHLLGSSMDKAQRLIFAMIFITLITPNASAMCTGDGCNVFSASILSLIFFWPASGIILLIAIINKGKNEIMAGFILATLGTIFVGYNIIIVAERYDLFYMPLSHLGFAFFFGVLYNVFQSKGYFDPVDPTTFDGVMPQQKQ